MRASTLVVATNCARFGKGNPMTDFIKSLWPRSAFTWLGLFLGAMSMLKLLQFGIQFGFGPSFAIVLSYYETLVHALFGWWAEPIVAACLKRANEYFGFDLKLYSHWKYLFLLLEAYVIRTATITFRYRLWDWALISLAWGTVCALSLSVVVGSFSLVSANVAIDIVTAISPALAYFLFDVINAAWATLHRNSMHWNEHTKSMSSIAVYFLVLGAATRHTLAGIVLGVTAVAVSHSYWPQFSSGLVIAAGLITIYALERLFAAIEIGRRLRVRIPERSWSEAYWGQAGAHIGAGILGTYFVTFLFVVANAGLRFYGL